MNCADLLIRELQSKGIDNLFTLCGNGLDPLLDAAFRGGMRVIDTRNEQAAAYMADVAGRTTRTLGVCAVSSGVAHLNGLTGVCNAWFDGSPMLLITGASDTEGRGRGSFQDMETADLARSLCKSAEFVEKPEELTEKVNRAIEMATAGRPGPVHLTIPMDILWADTESDSDVEKTGAATVVQDLPAPTDSIKKVTEAILQSQRPLIIAGSGVFYADGASALESLSEAMGAPVMVPIWDRGTVSRPFAGYCGVMGAASGGPAILDKADLVLLVGAVVDYRVGYLKPPSIAPDAVVVRIDIDANLLSQGIEPSISLHGDPKTVMQQIIDAISVPEKTGNDTWIETATDLRDRFYSGFAKTANPDDLPNGGDVVRAMADCISAETHMLIDGGNIGQWYHMLMNDRYPPNWITCGRSAVVGWGLPSAAAISALHPGERVLLLSGDGSATFTIAEIENAVRQGLPYVAVIADDSAWGIVVSGARKQNRPAVGAELGGIRFDVVAEGFGARGVKIDDLSTLASAIERGFESKVVTIIHVPIQTGGPSD